MLKVGYKINYGFYVNITIIGEDEEHFVLQDKKGNTRKIVKRLVNRYGSLIEED